MKSVQQTRHGTYVVTYDIASRLQTLRSRNLRVPRQDDPLFEIFHMSLFQKIQQALPSITIDTIEMSELRRKIWEQVDCRITNLSRQVVLSTCPEITDSNPKSEGLLLNVNRLFNTEGVLMGHGSRPGFNPLADQFDELVKKIDGRSVVLIEDGVFTGGTLRFVLQKLENRGIKIKVIVVGFCCNGSRAAIKEVFAGEIVMVHPIRNLIDWIPDHDLIPFSPNCGRVLGEQTTQGFMPIKTRNGFSCAYPYILPFGKIEKWASLPIGSARDLSRLCLDTSIEIFGRARHKITIGELLGKNPKVSIPIVIGAHKGIPALDTKIVSFLSHMRKRLD